MTTLTINITSDVYLEAVLEGTNALIQNVGNSDVLLTFSDSLPSEDHPHNHKLLSKTQDSITISGGFPSGNIYVKVYGHPSPVKSGQISVST